MREMKHTRLRRVECYRIFWKEDSREFVFRFSIFVMLIRVTS